MSPFKISHFSLKLKQYSLLHASSCTAVIGAVDYDRVCVCGFELVCDSLCVCVCGVLIQWKTVGRIIRLSARTHIEVNYHLFALKTHTNTQVVFDAPEEQEG